MTDTDFQPPLQAPAEAIAEARSYVETYRDDLAGRMQGRYLRVLLAAIDARDAEIDKLNIRIEVADNAALDLSAEIARLRAPPGADVAERAAQFRKEQLEPWAMRYPTMRAVDRAAQFDAMFASALQQYGDEKTATLRDDRDLARREIDRLRGPLGVDARELAAMAPRMDAAKEEYFAGRIQQYGDERAREARAAAIEAKPDNDEPDL